MNSSTSWDFWLLARRWYGSCARFGMSTPNFKSHSRAFRPYPYQRYLKSQTHLSAIPWASLPEPIFTQLSRWARNSMTTPMSETALSVRIERPTSQADIASV